MSQIPGWRRVIRAAGRLAALYVVTALALVVMLATIAPFFLEVVLEAGRAFKVRG